MLNTEKFLRQILVILFLCNFHIALAGQASKASKKSSCEGRIPKPYHLDEKKSVTFETESDSSECVPLYVGTEIIAYVSGHHSFGDHLVVSRCIEDASQEHSPAHKGGSTQYYYEEVFLDSAKKPQFTKVAAPDFTGFSNPTFCKSFMAYWGGDNATGYSAILYDLGSNKVVQREPLGAGNLETDNVGFFPEPVWNASTLKVTFDPTKANGTGAEKLKKATLSANEK